MPPPRQPLLILPAFPVWQNPAAPLRFTLTQKFISGVLEFQKLWQPSHGPVRVLAEPAPHPDPHLDAAEVSNSDLPFEVRFVNYQSPAIEAELSQSAAPPGAALLSIHYHQMHLAALCRRLNLPAVYVAEYTLNTRLQILRAQKLNPLIRLRRNLWDRQEERRIRQALRESAGVQCNGVPTFHAYQSLTNACLYFDTRITRDMLASDATIHEKFNRPATQPLRLAFSGRLIDMKGAPDLILIAEHLRQKNLPFLLNIYGAGERESHLRQQTFARGLQTHVTFHGNVDFHRDLVPAITHHTDLFLCPHPQGDPSCTYLETMACGTPIVGYDNEAFAGIVETSHAGWTVPLNHPRALAEKIIALAADPQERLDHALRSLNFATQHTMESAFERRVAHLESLLPPQTPDSPGLAIPPLANIPATTPQNPAPMHRVTPALR